MDPIGRTKFGVLAVGAVAASLILWLSISFWIEAWRQREDARLLARVGTLESALLDIARDAARERADAIALLGSPRIGGARSVDEIIRASLETLRGRIDSGLDGAVAAATALLDDPVAAGRLRHSTIALRASLDAITRTRRALSDQHASNARVLAGDIGIGSSRAREHAMRRTFTLGNRLIERLHLLKGGLYVEPRVNVPRITDLRRLRADLNHFTESVTRAAALDDALSSPRVTSITDGWELTPAAALVRVRAALEMLRLHERERTLEPALIAELDALAGAHARTASGTGRTDAVIRRATELDAGIDRAITAEVHALEAHAWRRLAIDSVLIAVCFWIGFASLQLLRNIQHHAWHDRLTDLPNRFRLVHLLGDALTTARERRETLALAVLDIDDFKSVNDSVGHAAGDALLRQLVARLAASLDPRDTLAALGGDQLALVIRSAGAPDEARAEAERLCRVCRTRLDAGGTPLRVTLSLGVACAGDETESAAELLERAVVAMRQAKDDGRDRVRLFDQGLAERNRERVSLENDLRRALEKNQLELHYQPKVNTRSARVDGLEALLRWRHPERGLVSPGLFVPIAERAGLIPEIGAWVLDEAVRQSTRWRRDGLDALQVAVNVSAEQLFRAEFVDEVSRTLARHALPARHLELEVTESVGMTDMATVVAQLDRLRALGVSIAVDDFGTEYSSLQYLEALPLDTLKIDRAFIAKLDDRKGRSLARTIVLMAGSLELATVAEGVETREQLERVVALGCDHVQGYFHSPPVPADDVPATIARIEGDSAERLRPAA